MAISYYRGDELPSWQGTITEFEPDGVPDLSSNWLFTVTLSKPGVDSVVKNSGVTGTADGVFTVAWAAGELDIEPGQWAVQLTGTRTADSRQFTVKDSIQISERSLAE